MHMPQPGMKLLTDIAGLGSKAKPGDEQDLKLLVRSLLDVCTFQWLRREKLYVTESELWMTKWYDLALNYYKVGLQEIDLAYT